MKESCHESESCIHYECVLQCVAVCCSVCVAVCCSVLHVTNVNHVYTTTNVCCSMLQYVAVCVL